MSSGFDLEAELAACLGRLPRRFHHAVEIGPENGAALQRLRPRLAMEDGGRDDAPRRGPSAAGLDVVHLARTLRLRAALRAGARSFDLGLVWGERTPRAVRRSLLLAKEILQPDAVLVLRDAQPVAERRVLMRDLQGSDDFEYLAGLGGDAELTLWRYRGADPRAVSVLDYLAARAPL